MYINPSVHCSTNTTRINTQNSQVFTAVFTCVFTNLRKITSLFPPYMHTEISELEIHSFLTLALDISEWLTYLNGRFFNR